MLDTIRNFATEPNFQDGGKIPGLSTITGLARVCRGFVRIFSKPLDKKVYELGIMKLREGNEYLFEEGKSNVARGFKDIGRGLVEMVPIIGNFSVYLYDRARKN